MRYFIWIGSNSTRNLASAPTSAPAPEDNAFVFQLFVDFGLKPLIAMLSAHAMKRRYILECGAVPAL